MNVLNIKSPSNLALLHGGEHYIFDKDTVEHVEPDIAQITDALQSFGVYKACVNYESALFKLSSESKETADIAFLNKQRTGCWRLIGYTLDYYEESRNENVKKAAKDIQFVIRTYRNLTELNLLEKTGFIDDAISALREAPIQPALNTLPSILSLVDDLEAQNTELNDLYFKREEDNGIVRGLGTLSEYRPQVDRAFLDFVADLNSAYRRNELGAKDPALKAAIEKVANKIAAFYNKVLEILAHRHATGKKKPQKPDISNPEVPGNGGDGGDEGGDGNEGNGGGETPGGDIHNPDIENPPIPPYIPDFE